MPLAAEALEGRQLLAMLVSEALSGTRDTILSGTVYEDVNRDQIKNDGENGIANWTLYLDLDNSGDRNADAVGDLEPTFTTNQDGDFSIAYLKPATYRLAQVFQDGWRAVSPASQDVVVDRVDHDHPGNDFFNFAGANIVGTVWHDLNADGIRDVDPDTGAYTEPGLSGWTVFLDLDKNDLRDAGDPWMRTDHQGHYAFLDIPPDQYRVVEELPSTWEASPTYDNKTDVEVLALETGTADFANYSNTDGSLTGAVWHDVNLDGVRNVDPVSGEFSEPGLEGWTVFLDADANGALDDGELSVVTDGDGEYAFISLPEGAYLVTELLPDGWDVSPDYAASNWVTVTADENTVAPDFANFNIEDGSIRGAVWNDVNRNGLRDTTLSGAFLEPGLANWTVYLDLNRNLVADAGEPATLTDASGTYRFSGLQIGEYVVRQIVPTGWEVAPGFDDNQTVRVYSGTETVAADFANFDVAAVVNGSIAGAVFNDLNGDGLRQAGEPGVTARTVFLDRNSNGVFDAGEPQAVTDGSGGYAFANVAPGTVSVVLASTVGWRTTSPPSGIYTVTLRNGAELAGYNFGTEVLKDSTIRGVVFHDADRDLVRDPGERGLANIPVYLDLDGDNTLDAGEPHTVTSGDQFFTPGVNEAGAYSFTHLGLGEYLVRFVLPETLSATPLSERSRPITLASAEDRSGVDSAARFRDNEIHGVHFDDLNENGVRDAGEPGIAGTTVYLDLDRDDAFDEGEPTAVTGSAGEYSFLGLSPGAYVVRTVVGVDRHKSFPATGGGILWPEGVSNLAVGSVSPESISVALAKDQSHRQSVSITLPGGGALTNLVDVFLLFDDTGSFVNNSPIVRGAFPQIISSLQTSLSGIDLAFGVGRFEEYGNFGFEYSSGRPFILNQPIVAASTPGYLTAIQDALNRTTPGYGGDQPETDIEALYQLVTGLGFDGNNNGSVLDSGAAGLISTQLSPGGSGDVPSFASFSSAASGLPSDGVLGGAGFRAGALPIILTATDTGFAYQPKGETSIAGVGGLTVPISALTGTSRPTTPYNSGAGIQETVTALNALGALVIGLGTNGQSNIDPRQGLEALSRLTGAVNRSTATIANGTADPIAPGDPFYFQIASGFASSVANGIVSAIQNAVTSVAVDITVQASDPRVVLINHTGTVAGVGGGQTATFDVEFRGDGIPHRFDLQFVRAGTNVVLGSIPVVLGTPVPGECYEFEDLVEGEIEYEDDFGSYDVSDAGVNAAPSFTKGADVAIAEDAPAQSIVGWATNIAAGPASEAWQHVDFLVSVDNAGLFSDLPAISPDGTLTFTPASGANGSANVTVRLHDDGGVAGGGVDTSAPQTFVINVSPVNDAPAGSDLAVETGSTASLSLQGDDGDSEVAQVLTFAIASGPAHGEITAFDPATGQATYVAHANYIGADQFTYTVQDDDQAGSPAGLVSAPSTVSLTIRPTRFVGTADADLLEVQLLDVGGAELRLNGAILGAVATGSSLSFDGLGGSDQLVVLGTSQGEAFSITRSLIHGGGLSIATTGVEQRTVSAGEGDDIVTLTSGSGASIDGGLGFDSLNYSAWTTPVTVNLATGAASGAALVAGIERVVGGKSSDMLTGGAGDEVFTGGPGSDVFTGGGGNDTLEEAGAVNFVLGAATLSGLGADRLNGIADVHLTDVGGGHSVTLSGWTAAARINGNRTTLNVTKDADFVLRDAQLTASDGLSALLSGVTVANLTGGLAANQFDVSGWTGRGKLSGGSGEDSLRLTQDAEVTLGATSLSTAAGLQLSLSSIEVAHLEGTSADNRFTIRDWKGTGSITGHGGADLLTVQRGGTIALADGRLSAGLMSMDLAGIHNAAMIGLGTADKFDLSGWTHTATLNGQLGADAVIVTKDADFVLSDSSLSASDGARLSLTGIEIARLTGGDGDNTFDVSGWTRPTAGLIDGAGGNDTVVAERDANFALSNLLLKATVVDSVVLNMKLASVETAQLTGGDSANRFNVSGWTGQGAMNGLAGDDTVSKSAGGLVGVNFLLRDDSLTVSDGAQLGLIDIEAASLTGTGLDDSVDISGWTKSGRLAMAAGHDTLHVAKDQDLRLSSSLLSGSDGLSMSVAGFELVVLRGGDGANLFDATGYGGAVHLIGAGGNDVLIGGSGADQIEAGDGDDLLLGDGGADTLDGGAGRDLLVGGQGTDTLRGGAGGDILIGGRTSYGLDLAAYDAILAEWKSAAAYALRTANIAAGGGAASPYRLAAGTLLDDTAIDTLIGGAPETDDADLDWFFHRIGSAAPDAIADLEAGELDTGF